MPITTVSSRQFNQDASGAKRAARKGPVFITDRGRPAHVLLTMDDFQNLSGDARSIVDRLSMPRGGGVAFDPPRLRGPLHRLPDWS